MKENSENNLYNILQDVHLFTALTDIKMHTVTLDNSHTIPCLFCNKLQHPFIGSLDCHDMITDALQYGRSNNCGCVMVCPTGFCHIITPIPKNDDSDTTEEVVLVSEPIVCGHMDSRAYLAPQKKLGATEKELRRFNKYAASLFFLPPGKIAKANRLLYMLANRCTGNVLPTSDLKQGLLQSIENNRPAEAEVLLENSLEEIIMRVGLNFESAKLICSNVIFTLYDIMEECAGYIIQDKSAPFIPTDLADADTLGKLKTCLTQAKTEFITVCFNPITIKHSATIHRALDLMEQNHTHRISLQMIASAVYMSPSHFSRVFKAVTGNTFIYCLNQMRIEKAKVLLGKPSVSLAAIHKLTGFDGRSYFNKIFHNFTGMTPKAYRNFIMQHADIK